MPALGSPRQVSDLADFEVQSLQRLISLTEPAEIGFPAISGRGQNVTSHGIGCRSVTHRLTPSFASKARTIWSSSVAVPCRICPAIGALGRIMKYETAHCTGLAMSTVRS